MAVAGITFRFDAVCYLRNLGLPRELVLGRLGLSCLWRGSLVLLARDFVLHDAQPMYELGLVMAQGPRFISSGLIAIFRQVLPLNGDSQNSIGYFLFVSVFVLACSSAVLARTLFDTEKTRVASTLVSTVSAFVVTMLHANNFDQLLATSLLPLITAAAFWLKWEDVRCAVLTGFLARPW